MGRTLKGVLEKKSNRREADKEHIRAIADKLKPKDDKSFMSVQSATLVVFSPQGSAMFCKHSNMNSASGSRSTSGVIGERHFPADHLLKNSLKCD